jgi:hypothetical protein
LSAVCARIGETRSIRYYQAHNGKRGKQQYIDLLATFPYFRRLLLEVIFNYSAKLNDRPIRNAMSQGPTEPDCFLRRIA